MRPFPMAGEELRTPVKAGRPRTFPSSSQAHLPAGRRTCRLPDAKAVPVSLLAGQFHTFL